MQQRNENTAQKKRKKKHPSTKSIHPPGHIRLFLSKITEQMANEAC
jgi:hypothetical protein